MRSKEEEGSDKEDRVADNGGRAELEEGQAKGGGRGEEVAEVREESDMMEQESEPWHLNF